MMMQSCVCILFSLVVCLSRRGVLQVPGGAGGAGGEMVKKSSVPDLKKSVNNAFSSFTNKLQDKVKPFSTLQRGLLSSINK